MLLVTLRSSFSDICSCIPKQDVVTFAEDLLQDGLHIYDGPMLNELDGVAASTREDVTIIRGI